MDRERRRRVEPWPIALALLVGLMMAISIGFYAVAATHPDPPVAEAAR